MRFYTTSRLSENMEFTPEGYLLCKGVPIARTGALEYLPEEVPEDVALGASGPTVLVYRDADELFSEETIASFEGKPVTIDHPDDFVTPVNWRELAVGHAQNVRQGEGKESDLLLADLLIKDQDAIDLIIPPAAEGGGEPEEPLREVSNGYDAEYVVVLPGIGKQIKIIGNHIALVPQGRCGSRCAIKDAAAYHTQTKEPTMGKTTPKTSWLDRILGNPRVKKAMDEAAAEEKAKDESQAPDKKDGGNSNQQIATDSPEFGEKLDELLIMMRSLLEAVKLKNSGAAADNEPEGALPAGDDDPDKTGDEEPEKTGDNSPAEPEKSQTGDARSRVADAATLARAGALAPGIRFTAADSATAVKRAALRSALGDVAVSSLVTACLGGTPLDKAAGVTLDSAFVSAAELMRARNNDRTGRALAGARARDAKAAGPTTPAEINKMNREFYDSQGKKE